MARLISFPFRLDAAGSVAVVEQESDQHVDELLTVAILTRPGERIQVPTFGIADPAFSHFQVGALQRHVADFGPAVQVEAVPVTVEEGRERIAVHWQRADRVESGGAA